MLTTVWRERRCFDVAHVDVFSGPAFRWAEAVCRMLRALHKPYVLTLHGGNLPAFANRAPERMRRLIGGATAVTAPSRYLHDIMRATRPDLRLLPNALQLDSYPFRLREHPQPRVVWLRAFHSIYNPEMAALVVAGLAAELPHISLAMIGPDKDGSLARTRRTARRLGVADRVTFVGAVPKPDVIRYLAAGDIFLNTTNVDNTPVSVLEALATGLCVVSTNVGGIPHLLENERDALLVPARDERAMAAAVRRLLTEPGLAGRLSRNARAKAEQFDWSIILPHWDALLRDAAHSSERQLNA
jgi:glycosyltransferase involved in cell wall biosynthesis